MLSKPDKFANVRGECNVCDKSSAAQIGAWGNFERHSKVQSNLKWVSITYFIFTVNKSHKNVKIKKGCKSHQRQEKKAWWHRNVGWKTVKLDSWLSTYHLLTFEQKNVDGLVVDYIIYEARPLATVTKKSFRKLVMGLNSRTCCMGALRLRKLI